MDEQTRAATSHLLRGRVVRLENLIGGILAYSRAGRDQRRARRASTSAALVAEVWELLSPPATAHLALPAPPTCRTLTASRTQLQQVLMNLIGNAIKYNPDRELHVELGAPRQIGPATSSSCETTAIGIAPEYHDKIWGLFQTLERRDKIESTGIGLSVVRKIVESPRRPDLGRLDARRAARRSISPGRPRPRRHARWMTARSTSSWSTTTRST